MFVRKFKLNYKPGIRLIISVVCVLGILGGSSFSIYYAMKSLYDSSLKDASTILFLDLESRSHNMSEALENFIVQSRKRQPLAEFLIKNKQDIKWLKGEFSTIKTFSDLGVDYYNLSKDSTEILNSFSNYNGVTFFVDRLEFNDLDMLKIYEISPEDISRAFSLNTKYTIIYILNRSGKLIFSNNQDISPENVMERPLVGSFIKMPFRQGQSEFISGGDALYGFFQEIPKSNMVIFAEKTKTRAMEEVYQTIRKVAAASIFYLIVAIVLLQFPLWKATKPIKLLTEMATKMSSGDFEVSLSEKGFGELAVLSNKFTEMADNLRKRDETIAALHIDKLEKTKLEQGIRVARAIQERFLFKPESTSDHKLSVGAQYEPSLYLAGDWYGVFYDAKRQETIIAIVDITGHGIESSMMTPVISVIFQEQKLLAKDSPFDIRQFLERCNMALYDYGSGVSTATGIVAKFTEADKTMRWLNAGHPAPIIVSADGAMIKTSGSGSSGSILGFAPQIQMAEQMTQLVSGSVAAFFSDGLLTAPVGGAVGFSRKDLLSELKKVKKTSVEGVLSGVMNAWRNKNGKIRIEDDMCLVVGLVK